jgi:hypothetical protein
MASSCFIPCFFTPKLLTPSSTLNAPSHITIHLQSSHQNFSEFSWSGPQHTVRWPGMFSSAPNRANPNRDVRGDYARRRNSLPYHSPDVLNGMGLTNGVPIPAGFPPPNRRRPPTIMNSSDRSPSTTTFEMNPYPPQRQEHSTSYEAQRAQAEALATRVVQLKDVITTLQTENQRLKDNNHTLERTRVSSDKLLGALTGYPLPPTPSHLAHLIHHPAPLPDHHPPALSLW